MEGYGWLLGGLALIACTSSVKNEAESDAGTGAEAGQGGTGGGGATSSGGAGGTDASTSGGGAAGSAATGGSGAGGVAGLGGSAGTAGAGGTAGTAGAGGTSGSDGGAPVPGESCKPLDPKTNVQCCQSAGTVNWHAARGSCQFKGGDLVKIESSVRNNAVVAEGYSMNAWIGLTDLAKETEFRWVDGTLLFGYAPWYSLGEPQSKNGGDLLQNCVFMNGQGEWFDLKCAADGVVPVRSWCCDLPP